MYIYIVIFWHEPFGWSISGDHVEVHHPKKGACIYIYILILFYLPPFIYMLHKYMFTEQDLPYPGPSTNLGMENFGLEVIDR